MKFSGGLGIVIIFNKTIVCKGTIPVRDHKGSVARNAAPLMLKGHAIRKSAYCYISAGSINRKV